MFFDEDTLFKVSILHSLKAEKWGQNYCIFFFPTIPKNRELRRDGCFSYSYSR